MEKSQPIPPKAWQRPWLVDDDLRHDEVISVGCPDVLTGERVIISFPVEEARAFMAGDNKWKLKGHLVIDRDLIKDLTNAYGRHGAMRGQPPDAIEHRDFPFMRFMPQVIRTYRTMGEGVPEQDDVQIPAPIHALIFLAVRKIHGHRMSRN